MKKDAVKEEFWILKKVVYCILRVMKSINSIGIPPEIALIDTNQTGTLGLA